MGLRTWAGRAAMACALLYPMAAEAGWHAASTPHFVVYADDSAHHVRQYATRLERFDQAIRAFTRTPDTPVAPVNRVTIFLLPSQEAVAALFDRPVGGVYIPRAGDSVAFAPRPGGGDWLRDNDHNWTLFHEYAHHFMLTTFSEGAFPTWLVEGMAELLGSATIDSRQVMLGGQPNGAHWDVNRTRRIPVATLLTADASAAQDVDGFYGQSWLLTHYLMMGGGGREALARYIGAINRGEPAAKASAAFGDLGQLDRKLRAYGERELLPGVPIPVAGLPIGEITVRALGEGEAAMMPVRVRSKSGPGPAAAAQNVTLARRLAAPWPADIEVQLILGEAELDAGNAAEADAAADRALAVDPKRVTALVQKGVARMLLAAKDRGTDAAGWKAVRQWFARAATLDRADPAPLIAYNRSYWEAGEAQGEDARDALLLAQSLAPQDVGLRMRTGRMLIAAGEAAEALTMLRVVASDPHAGSTRDVARRLVADLERGDLAAAQATVKATAPGRIADQN